MEDAIQNAIEIRGHEGAHGGFGHGVEMGVAMKGQGNEPINAWLPLYHSINAEHWKVVELLSKQLLGYFCLLWILWLTTLSKLTHFSWFSAHNDGKN